MTRRTGYILLYYWMLVVVGSFVGSFFVQNETLSAWMGIPPILLGMISIAFMIVDLIDEWGFWKRDPS